MRIKTEPFDFFEQKSVKIHDADFNYSNSRVNGRVTLALRWRYVSDR